MLADLWPAYALRVRTPRLTLRMPDPEELAALADLAARGIHRPDERPFLTPWTDAPPEVVAQRILQFHWAQLGSWTPADWQLSLGVFAAAGPVGMVTLRARDFAVVREVVTFSWLGLEHQGAGLGTEARTGLLALAFDHLGAVAARTEVFADNHASQGVSRRLGYEPDGISRDARGDEALVSDRLRLTAERWATVERAPVEAEGVSALRSMMGL